MNAGEICNREVVVAYRTMKIADAANLMRENGVRRVPVLTHSGALAGIVAIGDVLDIVAEQLSDVVRAIARERHRETRMRR